MRLDKYLHKNSYTTSRNRAQYLIANKKVKVGERVVTKSSYNIEDEEITILEDIIYVSRAAYKLKHFFDNFNINVNELDCLDIGSSTGGFVQILCEYGAKRVVAVDVGSNQLDKSVKAYDKVESFENCDIRSFESDKSFDFVTCDVSFVGISYIIKEIHRLSSDKIVILFKPQFEVGRDVKRDKKGVVKDKEAILKASNKFENDAQLLGWKLLTKENSQVKGKDGNEEIFYYFTKH
jgi:23S rRNA (cytidine1920-2'-O)/16S rRNA (cytidine1409-2'-O)-methyltransferase